MTDDIFLSLGILHPFLVLFFLNSKAFGNSIGMQILSFQWCGQHGIIVTKENIGHHQSVSLYLQSYRWTLMPHYCERSMHSITTFVRIMWPKVLLISLWYCFERFNKSFLWSEILHEICTDLFVVIFSSAINCFFLVFRVKYLLNRSITIVVCSIHNYSDKSCAWHARWRLKLK